MNDDDPQSAIDPSANGQDDSPVAGLISQYVKDLSFENPNAPAIYQSTQTPAINVQFDIAANQLGEEAHEVVLKVEVCAENDGQVAFLVELSYAGLFGLRNVPAEHVQPFLLAEAPRLIFPFARRVIADTVRDGGFPPLLLEPLDFGALYAQQLGQAENQQGAVGHA